MQTYTWIYEGTYIDIQRNSHLDRDTLFDTYKYTETNIKHILHTYGGTDTNIGRDSRQDRYTVFDINRIDIQTEIYTRRYIPIYIPHKRFWGSIVVGG